MPNTQLAGVGRALPPPRTSFRITLLSADAGPLAPWSGLKVQWSELVDADHDGRLAVVRDDLTVGDRVEMLDACLLGLVVRVGRGLPGLQALKRDALLTEQNPQALMADVVDHPLGDQELRQLRQTPGRERQPMFGGPRLGDLLDFQAFRQGELPGPAPGVLRVERREPVVV